MPDRKKSIVIYTDLIQHLEMLSTEEVGSVFLGILNYAEYGEIPNLTSAAGMCFSFIRSQIDRDSDKWERTREKRIASGRAGGIASGESRSTAKQNEANEANAYSSKQNEANEAVTVPVTVPVTVNGTVNKSINSADKPRRFTKPTVEDISEYCKERGNSVEPQRFYDFYEAKGWYIGKNPMKDWKAAVRTWEQSEKRNGAAGIEQPSKPPEQERRKFYYTDTDGKVKEGVR